jgi:hypothetical protein
MPDDMKEALVFLESRLDKLKQQEQNVKNNKEILYNLF